MISTPSSEEHRLEALGWNAYFEDQFQKQLNELHAGGIGSDSEPPNLTPARVAFESRQQYRVLTADGERGAKLSGRMRRGETLPAVGDWVFFIPPDDGDDETVTLQGILPRRTCLSRKVAGQVTQQQVVAANLDHVFLVMGLDGDFNLRRLERFTVMAHESGAQPVVILSKADLSPNAIEARLDAQQVAPQVPVFVVSALAAEGLEALRSFLEPGCTVALIGSSGAGKSTLLNRLCGAPVMATGSVRQGDDRGRHTTTHRQLVLLPSGGLLVDNPGVREIQLWADEDALVTAFDDIEALSGDCRFRDCSHFDEPGCGVRRAIREGRLDAARLASWQGLEQEIQRLELRKNIAERRRQDRQLGRLYKSVQQAKKKRQR